MFLLFFSKDFCFVLFGFQTHNLLKMHISIACVALVMPLSLPCIFLFNLFFFLHSKFVDPLFKLFFSSRMLFPIIGIYFYILSRYTSVPWNSLYSKDSLCIILLLAWMLTILFCNYYERFYNFRIICRFHQKNYILSLK